MSAGKTPERFGPTVYLSESGSTTVSSVRLLQTAVYCEHQLPDGRESQHYGQVHIEFARRPDLNIKIGGVSVVSGDRNEICEEMLDFDIKEIDRRLYAVQGRDLVQIGARNSAGDRILDAEFIIQHEDLPVLAHRAPVTLEDRRAAAKSRPDKPRVTTPIVTVRGGVKRRDYASEMFMRRAADPPAEIEERDTEESDREANIDEEMSEAEDDNRGAECTARSEADGQCPRTDQASSDKGEERDREPVGRRWVFCPGRGECSASRNKSAPAIPAWSNTGAALIQSKASPTICWHPENVPGRKYEQLPLYHGPYAIEMFDFHNWTRLKSGYLRLAESIEHSAMRDSCGQSIEGLHLAYGHLPEDWVGPYRKIFARPASVRHCLFGCPTYESDQSLGERLPSEKITRKQATLIAERVNCAIVRDATGPDAVVILTDEATGYQEIQVLPTAKRNSDTERTGFFRILREFVELQAHPKAANVSEVIGSGFTDRCSLGKKFYAENDNLFWSTSHQRAALLADGRALSIRKIYADRMRRIRLSTGVPPERFITVVRYIADSFNLFRQYGSSTPTLQLSHLIDDRRRMPYGAPVVTAEGMETVFAGYSRGMLKYEVEDGHGGIRTVSDVTWSGAPPRAPAVKPAKRRPSRSDDGEVSEDEYI